MSNNIKIKASVLVNESIINNESGRVLFIILDEEENISLEESCNEKYDKVVVITTGDKLLNEIDFISLRNIKVPIIDLSKSNSTKIPKNAFRDCDWLKEFKYPASIEIIEDNAFDGCSSLTGDLIIPDSVKTIGINVFNNCSNLTGNLVVGSGIEVIGSHMFAGTNFKGELRLKNGLKTIEPHSFYNCNFTGNLIIPDTVEVIGGVAFGRCNGFNGVISIGDNVRIVGTKAFYNVNNIDKITLNNGEEFSKTNYRKAIVDNLPKDKVTMVVSSDFNPTNTWIKDSSVDIDIFNI